ncbi:MAG: hypothetical protein RR280_03735 [Bacteroidaceae bacterium]
MNENKKSLLSDSIPSMEKDSEGKLRGGFTSLSSGAGDPSDGLVNIICSGCDINIPCSDKNCTKPPVTPTPTTPAPTTPAPTIPPTVPPTEAFGVLFGLDSTILF